MYDVGRGRILRIPAWLGLKLVVRIRPFVMVLASLEVVACGGSGTSPSATPPVAALTGTVTDPAGDAVTRPGVAISPDLVAAVIEVSAGNLTLTVTLAPGTLSQTQTLVSTALDTDENPATGSPGIDSGATDAALIGTDYVINAVAPRGSAQALILKAVGNAYQFTTVGTATVSFPAADQLRVTVPLSMLGNDDGRLKFKVTCSQYLTDTSVTGITDYMPNAGVAAGVVR